ncbi:hypothetical protein C8Q75DRAFT_812162 [Abortiporus biennis]|nr:hypothetical protein C8Q75DRAFT_812162 [Abortiporus biennis]
MSRPINLQRPHPFSLQDFQQLVSSAFDSNAGLADLSPLSDASELSDSPFAFNSPSSFDSESDDEDIQQGHGPASDLLRSETAKAPLRNPLNLFKSIRTRASTLLRSYSYSSPSDFDLHSISETSLPSTARPSTSSRTALDNIQQPRPSTSHSITSRSSFAFSPFDLTHALSRSRSQSLPRSFLDISTSSRQTPMVSQSIQPYSSFFDDSALNPRHPVPSYARPSTPASRSKLHIHTRLPPLRKSRSYALTSFTNSSRKRNSSKTSDIPQPPYSAPIGTTGFGFAVSLDDPVDPLDPSCTRSPFSSPRAPPPIPTNIEPTLHVPAYVFERRGSATSTNTTHQNNLNVGRQDFPGVLWVNGFAFFKVSVAIEIISVTLFTAFHGVSLLTTYSKFDHFPHKVSFVETKDEILAIGRVLTPEDDPFAKPELVYEEDITPRAMLDLRGSPNRVHRGSLQEDTLRRTPDQWPPRRGSAVAPSRADRMSMNQFCSPSPAYMFPSAAYSSPNATHSLPPTPTRGLRNSPSTWSPQSSPGAARRGSAPSTLSFPMPPPLPQHLTRHRFLLPNKPLPRLPTEFDQVTVDWSDDEDLSQEDITLVSCTPPTHSRRRQVTSLSPSFKPISERPPSPFPLVDNGIHRSHRAEPEFQDEGYSENDDEVIFSNPWGTSGVRDRSNAVFAWSVPAENSILDRFSTPAKETVESLRSLSPIPKSRFSLDTDEDDQRRLLVQQHANTSASIPNGEETSVHARSVYASHMRQWSDSTGACSSRWGHRSSESRSTAFYSARSSICSEGSGLDVFEGPQE